MQLNNTSSIVKLIPKCANSSSNHNLKGFETRAIFFFLMENYKQGGQAYKPLSESMNKQKNSNIKK
jgi:hypothetical protein